MNALPLFYYPTTILWVDDDKNFLNSMVFALGKTVSITPFQSAADCLKFLSKYTPLSANYTGLSKDFSDEDYSSIQRTHVNFDLANIRNIFMHAERTKEISLILIDHHMPEMDGLTFAKEIKQLPLSKLLLTGNLKENIAVNDGFNKNLIDCYLKKGGASIYEDLKKHIASLSYQYFQRITQNLLLHLEIENKLPQSDSIFVDFFESYCVQHEIVEYYLIDKCGSYFCINKKSKPFYFVVRTKQFIISWLDIYHDNDGMSEPLANQLTSGNKIPFFGIDKEACEISSAKWHNYFYDAKLLSGGRENYYWTSIDASKESDCSDIPAS